MDTVGIYKVLGILTTAYPRYYRGLTKAEMDETAGLWFDMLSDLEESLCLMAIRKSIATSVYPPTIAEIRKACVYIQQPKKVEAGEAWGEVLQAVRRFGYMRQIEAVASLSPLTRKVVQQMGFGAICRSEDPMVDRAHFLKIYDAVAKMEQEYQQLPRAIRRVIEQNAAAVAMVQGTWSVI